MKLITLVRLQEVVSYAKKNLTDDCDCPQVLEKPLSIANYDSAEFREWQAIQLGLLEAAVLAMFESQHLSEEIDKSLKTAIRSNSAK